MVSLSLKLYCNVRRGERKVERKVERKGWRGMMGGEEEGGDGGHTLVGEIKLCFAYFSSSSRQCLISFLIKLYIYIYNEYI